MIRDPQVFGTVGKLYFFRICEYKHLSFEKCWLYSHFVGAGHKWSNNIWKFELDIRQRERIWCMASVVTVSESKYSCVLLRTAPFIVFFCLFTVHSERWEKRSGITPKGKNKTETLTNLIINLIWIRCLGTPCWMYHWVWDDFLPEGQFLYSAILFLNNFNRKLFCGNHYNTWL